MSFEITLFPWMEMEMSSVPLENMPERSMELGDKEHNVYLK